MATQTIPPNRNADACGQVSASPLTAVLTELNRTYPDGERGTHDAKASSQGFLRTAAFARESLLEPVRPDALIGVENPLQTTTE